MEILDVLTRWSGEHGREFLVVGGLAVNAHGFSRFTADVDILVRRAESPEWIALLAGLGYVAVNEVPAFVQLVPPLIGLWPVDLMRVSDATFASLSAESCEARLLGSAVRIPSVEHLCALKLHALRQGLPHRDARDFEDLMQLVRIHRIDVNGDPFRRLAEKYGSPSIHERLQAALFGRPERRDE